MGFGRTRSPAWQKMPGFWHGKKSKIDGVYSLQGPLSVSFASSTFWMRADDSRRWALE